MAATELAQAIAFGGGFVLAPAQRLFDAVASSPQKPVSRGAGCVCVPRSQFISRSARSASIDAVKATPTCRAARPSPGHSRR